MAILFCPGCGNCPPLFVPPVQQRLCPVCGQLLSAAALVDSADRAAGVLTDNRPPLPGVFVDYVPSRSTRRQTQLASAAVPTSSPPDQEWDFEFPDPRHTRRRSTLAGDMAAAGIGLVLVAAAGLLIVGVIQPRLQSGSKPASAASVASGPEKEAPAQRAMASVARPRTGGVEKAVQVRKVSGVQPANSFAMGKFDWDNPEPTRHHSPAVVSRLPEPRQEAAKVETDPEPKAPGPAPVAPVPIVIDPPPVRCDKPPAVCKDPESSFGTSVHFAKDPSEGAKQALAEHKLLVVFTISGNFEDSKFT